MNGEIEALIKEVANINDHDDYAYLLDDITGALTIFVNKEGENID